MDSGCVLTCSRRMTDFCCSAFYPLNNKTIHLIFFWFLVYNGLGKWQMFWINMSTSLKGIFQALNVYIIELDYYQRWNLYIYRFDFVNLKRERKHWKRSYRAVNLKVMSDICFRSNILSKYTWTFSTTVSYYDTMFSSL